MRSIDIFDSTVSSTATTIQSSVQNPFIIKHDLPVNFFFKNHARLHQLNFLTHLCQFSYYILAAVGPTGTGKTTLKQHFIRENESNLNICSLDAKTLLSVPILMQAIAMQFGLPWSSSTTTQYTITEEYLPDPDARPWVVVIDNAEDLSADVFEALLKLARGSLAAKPLLHIVLFGLPSIQDLFNKPVIANLCHDALHRLDLEGLTEEEFGAYIHFNLEAVGFPQKAHLGRSVMKSIWLASDGSFADLNKRLSAALFENKSKNVKSKLSVSPATWFRPALLLPVFALISIIGMSYLSLMLNREAEVPSVSMLSRPSTEIDLSPPVRVITTETATKPAEETLSLNTDATLAELAKAAAQKPAEVSLVVAKEVVASEEAALKTEAEPIAQTEVEPVAVAVPVPPQPKPEAAPKLSQATATVKQHANSKLKNPLLTRSPKHFTVQVAGFAEEARMQQTLQKIKSVSGVYSYKTMRHGKPWFVVGFGDFASPKAAQDAAKKLPGTLKNVTPWVRSVASVQKDLNQM